MIFFDLVIFTGLFGMCCYLFVPRLLTSIEENPLLIEDLKTRREELKKELADLVRIPSEPLGSLIRNKVVSHFASFRYLLRQYWRREKLEPMLEAAETEFEADNESLLRFHMKQHEFETTSEVDEQGRRSDDEGFIDEISAAIEAASRDQIKLKCAIQAGATLRRVDALIYLHILLKLWLAPHIVFTSLMLALMFIHVIQVIYYALR